MSIKSLKLIVVFSSFDLKLYEARGRKITGALEVEQLPFERHARHEKHEGLYQKASSPGSEFYSRTSPADIDHQNAARIIVNYLDKILFEPSKYRELIMIGEPQTLGYFRKHTTSKIEKLITKSIAKNLAHCDVEQIEKVAFETD